MGLALVAFGAVTGDVLGRDELASFDMPVNEFIATSRSPWLTTLMLGATVLGSFPGIPP